MKKTHSLCPHGPHRSGKRETFSNYTESNSNEEFSPGRTGNEQAVPERIAWVLTLNRGPRKASLKKELKDS